jgi:hypothetical protein
MNINEFLLGASEMARSLVQRLWRWFQGHDSDRNYLAAAVDLTDLERRLRALEHGTGTPRFVTTFNF